MTCKLASTNPPAQLLLPLGPPGKAACIAGDVQTGQQVVTHLNSGFSSCALRPLCTESPSLCQQGKKRNISGANKFVHRRAAGHG